MSKMVRARATQDTVVDYIPRKKGDKFDVDDVQFETLRGIGHAERVGAEPADQAPAAEIEKKNERFERAAVDTAADERATGRGATGRGRGRGRG